MSRLNPQAPPPQLLDTCFFFFFCLLLLSSNFSVLLCQLGDRGIPNAAVPCFSVFCFFLPPCVETWITRQIILY